MSAQFVDQIGGGLIGEYEALAFAGGLRARHYVSGHFGIGESAAHAQSGVESFAAHDGGVDGGEEWSHRVALGHEEEIDRAVGAGDVAVEGDAEAEDDFAHPGNYMPRGSARPEARAQE